MSADNTVITTFGSNVSCPLLCLYYKHMRLWGKKNKKGSQRTSFSVTRRCFASRRRKKYLASASWSALSTSRDGSTLFSMSCFCSNHSALACCSSAINFSSNCLFNFPFRRHNKPIPTFFLSTVRGVLPTLLTTSLRPHIPNRRLPASRGRCGLP